MPHKDTKKILKPTVHASVFVAEGARIFGEVEIGEGSSVWFNAVIRGDEGGIIIGKHTNIQENAVVHTDLGTGTLIGDEVTIGHGAIIRGCKIGRGVMIGMNATVMSHAEIGEDSIVGANAVIPYRAKFPPRSVILGMPAKRVRELKTEELGTGRLIAQIYKELMQKYKEKKILGYTEK